MLSKVIQYEQDGWPSLVSNELQPFWIRRNTLSIECSCLFWGIRVNIPSQLHYEGQRCIRTTLSSADEDAGSSSCLVAEVGA